MWPWLVGAWIVAAGLVAWLHHRFRSIRPALAPELEAFLVQFENSLARRPQVDYLGLLPGQFTALLRLHGQETPVALQAAWRHAQAFPAAFEAMVDRLLADVEELGLDRVGDHDFAAVATSILPQVRSRAWLEQHGCFGDAGLVHRPLNDELVVGYVIDDHQSMTFVCRAHLQRWRKSEADLYHLALSNLQRLGSSGLDVATGPLLLHTGDGYDAARVLLLDRGQPDLLVAIPDRDVLWIAPEQGQDLPGLMATAQELARAANHPVSPSLYRLRDGRLETIPVSD